MKRACVAYKNASCWIEDADVLLFRGGGWASPAVRFITRSEYSHVGMACRFYGQLLCLQQTSLEDHKPLLEGVVFRCPGLIDVCSISPDYFDNFDKRKAVQEMIRLVDPVYGWRNAVSIGIRHIPYINRVLNVRGSDNEPLRWPPVCSAAVAAAYRYAGTDLVPHRSDRLTEPKHIAAQIGNKLTYKFTLTWEPWK